MSRYNGSNGGSSGGNNGDYEDDRTLKLSEYAAVRLTPDNSNAFTHDQYGSSFIVNYDDAEVVDGVVLQREDKPGTWKIFSANKFFNLNPEDGLIYENYDEEDGYTVQMSAQDILDAPRVSGYSDSAGGEDYYYTPVGVVIEEAGDIAINDDFTLKSEVDDPEEDDFDFEVTNEPAIVVGSSSMLLSNNSWVRTFAKKMTTEGDSIINDNGEDPTPRGEEHDNPKYSSHEWLSTEDPTLRGELEGRELELWVTEETNEWDDGETSTYKVPNVMDVKTGNFVTIDNGITESDDDSGSEQAKATDGGTKAESGSDTTDTESTESPDEPSASSESSGLPDGVPDSLETLLDYMVDNSEGDTTADEVRTFAEDEVDDPDEVDWEAAASEINSRAE